MTEQQSTAVNQDKTNRWDWLDTEIDGKTVRLRASMSRWRVLCLPRTGPSRMRRSLSSILEAPKTPSV